MNLEAGGDRVRGLGQFRSLKQLAFTGLFLRDSSLLTLAFSVLMMGKRMDGWNASRSN